MHAHPQGCMHIHSHIPLYITMVPLVYTQTTMRHWQGALHAPSCSYCPECGSESIAVPLELPCQHVHTTPGARISRDLEIGSIPRVDELPANNRPLVTCTAQPARPVTVWAAFTRGAAVTLCEHASVDCDSGQDAALCSGAKPQPPRQGS